MPTAFYETYRQLCQKAGKSDNAVAAEIGLSNSTVTTWRQGALPRRPTIKKVADYFGVTVEEMMGYSDIEKKPAPEGGRKRKLRSVARLESTEDISPEMDRNIVDYIDFLLQKREQEKREQGI